MGTPPSLFKLVVVLGLSCTSLAVERTIDEEAARKLVEGALPALGENQTSVQIGPWRYYWAPEFYTFTVWRHNPAAGLVITYYLAVNPWTGDVWDAMACKRITTPEIQGEQEAIWKRSGIPSEARDTIRNKSPADCASYREKRGAKKKCALSENLAELAYYAGFSILCTARSSRLLTDRRLALSSR